MCLRFNRTSRHACNLAHRVVGHVLRKSEHCVRRAARLTNNTPIRVGATKDTVRFVSGSFVLLSRGRPSIIATAITVVIIIIIHMLN